MKLSLNINIILLFTAVFAACTSCKKPVDPIVTPPTTNEMSMTFSNYFGNDKLELNTGTYTTAQNEQITVTTFNYWISNVVFVKTDGTEFAEPESYHLVRGNDLATHHFHVENVPAGTYKSVKFIIGVDVPRNTAGAQTGALDPAVNGDMYWSWNQGYIQAKMEGTSPQSAMPNHTVVYHIGGIQPGYETPRNVSLTFPQNVEVGTGEGALELKADAAAWFGPSTPLKIADNPNVQMGGQMAAKIADNYQKMITVTSAGNE